MPIVVPALALVPALTLGAGLFSIAPEEPAVVPADPLVLTIRWDPAPGIRAEVDPALYAAAEWPAHNTELYAEDFQGQKLPVALGNETWLTAEKDLGGKVLLLDFWATWCGPCIAAMPKLAEIQRSHPERLAVVGVSGRGEDSDTVRSHLAKKETAFSYIHDDEERLFKSFRSRGIPLLVLVSTDGVIRWMGNPFEPDFKAAVEQVLRVDPGL